MEIILSSPKEVTLISEVKKTIDKITVVELIDYPERKLVVAKTKEAGRIVLWEGAAYDAIGQWTDTDVINKINTLYF